jgi:hypothetical protein
MLFEPRLKRGIADGSITVAFRRWKRPQVVAGGRYRTGEGLVEATSVDEVEASKITKADARRAGYESVDELLRTMPERNGTHVYRIGFRPVRAADPRDELAASDDLSADDVADITVRLERLDRASSHGPWTADVLACIATEPGRRAPDFAARFGRDVQPFKRDVRKLKELGLTTSLLVGYELSPRGAAYLRAVGKPVQSSPPESPRPAASSTKRAARKTAAP